VRDSDFDLPPASKDDDTAMEAADKARKKVFAPTPAGMELTLPATSANLGPAFDAAAVALALHLRIRAVVAEEFSIVARGRDAAICGRLPNHLILDVYRQVLAEQGRTIVPLALDLDNCIPIGKGCGSSAAARLAGVALAAHFGGLGWSAETILEMGCRLEGHPDNAAACWWGGLIVARQSHALQAPLQVVRLSQAPAWPGLLVLPERPLPTSEARRVLPASYSRSDAVSNLQNALLFLAAWVEGRPEMLATIEDRMHEPQRAALCPLLPVLRPLAGTPGILGVFLSGAGPGVLLWLSGEHSQSELAARVVSHLERAGLEAELVFTRVEMEGGAGRRPLVTPLTATGNQE